jgi:hypothetical protein
MPGSNPTTLHLQRQRCSRLERFYAKENVFITKTRHAISCAVNFYKRWRCNSKSEDWHKQCMYMCRPREQKNRPIPKACIPNVNQASISSKPNLMEFFWRSWLLKTLDKCWNNTGEASIYGLLKMLSQGRTKMSHQRSAAEGNRSV